MTQSMNLGVGGWGFCIAMFYLVCDGMSVFGFPYSLSENTILLLFFLTIKLTLF